MHATDPVKARNGHTLTWMMFAAFYEAGKISTTICHGSVILLKTRLSNGKLLAEGKQWTGFCDAEEEIVDKAYNQKVQPFRIEAEAQKIPNTRFVQGAPYRPFAVRDGLLISGQQGSSNARAELPSLPRRTLLVGLSSGAATAGDTALELRPGSPHWLASDPARALTAPAGQEMELIAIQFK